MKRRALLRSVIGAVAFRTMPFAPVVLMAAPARAQEPVSTSHAALTAAIFVVQAIRSATQGDGGLGASLSAINGKVDLAISQLASIQKSLGFIITQLASLQKDFVDALANQYAREKCNEIIAAVNDWNDAYFEAERRKVDFTSGSSEAKDYLTRLSGIWNEFDKARRTLLEWPQGVAPYTSTMSEACAAMDAGAFGLGLINDVRLAVKLARQEAWLNKIIDPNVEYSAGWELAQSRAREKKIIADAEGEAVKGDFPKFVAVAVYKANPAAICIVNQMDSEFWSELPPKIYVKAGTSTTVLIAKIASRKIDHSGATFIDHLEDKDHIVAFYRPDGHIYYGAGTDAESVDRKTCYQHTLAPYTIGVVPSFKSKFHLYSAPGQAWNDDNFSGHIFERSRIADHYWWNVTRVPKWMIKEFMAKDEAELAATKDEAQKGLLTKRIASSKNQIDTRYFPLDEAQLVLDAVNAEAHRQAYCKHCSKNAADCRVFVRVMRAQLPDVSEHIQRGEQ